MKSIILTILLAVSLIGNTVGQIQVYPSDRYVFSTDDVGGVKVTRPLNPLTSTEDIHFSVFKEFIMVYGSDHRETKFTIKKITHLAKSKYWSFSVVKDNVEYEVHLHIDRKYIVFITKDPNDEGSTVSDYYGIDFISNPTKSLYWGV